MIFFNFFASKGYAVDLVVCCALGVDMFDCVFPSRTARFGTALVMSGSLNLKQKQFKNDQRPIEEDCNCRVCKNYTRQKQKKLLFVDFFF